MSEVASPQAAEQFVEKWRDVEPSERAASHERFIDLCRLVGVPTPAQADPTGQEYTFEKPVKVIASASKGSKGEGGFVDVWKKGCFAWEYKRKDKYKSLDEAYRQLYQYRDDLDNPPLSVVCDIRTTEIRTHFPGYPSAKTVIKLDEVPGRLEVLRRVFTSPETFRPPKTSEALTTELAGPVRGAGQPPDRPLPARGSVAMDRPRLAGRPLTPTLTSACSTWHRRCRSSAATSWSPAKSPTATGGA